MISCDPGVHKCYFARWEGGRLNSVWVDDTNYYTGPRLLPLVIEKPQVYQGRAQKGDPNDLIDLAISVGRVAAGFEIVEYVKPRTWKGQVPKAIMTKRIRSKLSQVEFEILGKCCNNHNIIDAVGLGLWKLGRL